MMTTLPASLAEYTDAQLCEFYSRQTAGDEWAALIEAEMTRRDAQDHATATADPRAVQRAEWERMAHAQWLDAERTTCGYLLNGRGIAAGIDPWSLWSGPVHRAEIYASEELLRYWLEHPRIDITTFHRQAAGEHRAWLDRHDREASDDQLDRDVAGRIRPGASQGEGAAVRADRGRDIVSPAAARAGAQDSRYPAVAGAGGTIRGGRVNEITTGRDARQAERLARRDRVAAGIASGATVAGEQDEPQVNAAPAAYRSSTAAVALRSDSTVARQDREPVDGSQTLAYARQFLQHFCLFPSEAALTVCTVWVAHCWARDATKTLVFMSTPLLLFSSLEPGSGKSAAMKLISRLCPDPALFTEPSEPAVAHSIGDHATLFLDEIDVLFGTSGTRKSAIRAVINDGYTEGGYWPRVRNGVTHKMPTFGPLAMAGLDKVESGTSGVMAATLSRCIRIRMKRAPEDYRSPRWDHQARMAASLIGERLRLWASQNLDALATHVPELDGIGNRDAELWDPLAATADIAGGPWPQLIRDAAEELITTGGMPEEDEDQAARLDEIMAGWEAGE